MNAGVGGAENAWFGGWAADAPVIPSLGSWEDEGRLEAEVLTDKFFIFRIFLLGESDLSKPGRVGKELENWSRLSIAPGARTRFVLVCLNVVFGDAELGDSGDELGEGSVSEDSTVEMVVVGEDSLDSKVDVESRRMTEEF